MYVAIVSNEFVASCEAGRLYLTMDVDEALVFPDKDTAVQHLSGAFGIEVHFQVFPLGLFSDGN